MDKDISGILEGWEYKPNEISIRKVVGVDGRIKIQMRLELGLLQMEIEGNPAGKRPHGKESLLEHYLCLLEEYRAKHGTDEGFQLDGEDCARLALEATQYYHRYLSLMVLEAYEGVVRDTARNLRALDLVKRYAKDEQDKISLDQYRPYIVMINTRGGASLRLQRKDYAGAIRLIEEGISKIEAFFEEYHQPELAERSGELSFLRNWAAEVAERRPLSMREKLQKQLRDAVEREDFERAVHLRDMIQNMERPDDSV